MGTQIWISLGYLIPRVLGWMVLFSLALWDTLRHRTLKKRGWQLNRAILVSALPCGIGADSALEGQG